MATINTFGVKATTLTPFCYHSLTVQRGSATLPELISDRAIAFGLASTLGMLRASSALPIPRQGKKGYETVTEMYRTYLSLMPYRCSVFFLNSNETPPRLLPPIARRCNVTEEGGYNKDMQNIFGRGKGNLKEFFYTQEVPEGQIFTGAIFSDEKFDPFAGQQELVIRVGLHRNGMVLLEKLDKKITNQLQVRLNASTAALFNRELPKSSNGERTVERYYLHTLQISRWFSLSEAKQEVEQWR
jgi:hypothetical protein